MKEKKIGSIQIDLIKKSKNFIFLQKKRGTDVSRHPSCYLVSWSKEYGNLVLKSFNKENKNLSEIYYNLKEIYKQYKFSKILIFNKCFKSKPFKRLVVTWCLSNDFKNFKNYYDRYFSMRAKDNKSTVWALISFDNQMKIPSSYDNNVIIIKNKSGSVLNFLISSCLMIFNFYLRRKENLSENISSLHSINGCGFEEKFRDFVIDLLNIYPIKEVILPYECQPFQNFLIKEIHTTHPKISTVGYIHSALPPLPTDFIKREGSPKKLIVHGIEQKKILYKSLGWKASEIRNESSARYKIKSKINFSNKIFLPMSFERYDLILNGLENFFRFSKNYSLPFFEIRNHPAMHKSKKHHQLIEKITTLIKKYKNKFSRTNSKKKLSIFISATAAIIEALERGTQVIHICSLPIYESHNSRIWKNLKVELILENVFSYRLKKRKKYIFLGKENKTFEKWIR